MVFYDLPVVSRKDRKAYARFHKFLLRDGYDMVQFSIYARICSGQDAVAKHVARLRTNLPGKGSVRSMQVTEKQFADIKVLVGERKTKEHGKFAEQLSFF